MVSPSPYPVPAFDPPISLSLVPLVSPASVSPMSRRRATQEELQRGASPAAETPPLQRRPSVRAVISTVEPSAGHGRPQVEPISETEEARRSGPARPTTSNANPTSPDLGPRGPELAGLQAERDVVSLRAGHQFGAGKDCHDHQVRLEVRGGLARFRSLAPLDVTVKVPSSRAWLSSRSVATTHCSS